MESDETHWASRRWSRKVCPSHTEFNSSHAHTGEHRPLIRDGFQIWSRFHRVRCAGVCMAIRLLFAFSCWLQVTRDGHPVIHHDVAVDLGGVRIPVVSLTLQEFLVIRDANHSSQQPHVASALPDEGSSRHRNRSLSPRSRGKSDEGLLFARFEMKSGLSFCCLRICDSGQPWLSLINFRH